MSIKIHFIISPAGKSFKLTFTIINNGEEKEAIAPYRVNRTIKKIQDTPLFGMYKDDKESIDKVIDKLRS